MQSFSSENSLESQDDGRIKRIASEIFAIDCETTIKIVGRNGETKGNLPVPENVFCRNLVERNVHLDQFSIGTSLRHVPFVRLGAP